MANCAHCLTALSQHAVEIEVLSRPVDTVRDGVTGSETQHSVVRVHPGCLDGAIIGGVIGLLSRVAV